MPRNGSLATCLDLLHAAEPSEALQRLILAGQLHQLIGLPCTHSIWAPCAMPCPATRTPRPQVLVKLNGVAPKAAGATLKSFITHPGRASVMNVDGNPSDFVHLDRRTVCEYDIATSAVKTQVSIVWGRCKWADLRKWATAPTAQMLPPRSRLSPGSW